MPRVAAGLLLLASAAPALAQPKTPPAPPAASLQAPTLATPANLGVRRGASATFAPAGTKLDAPTGLLAPFPLAATFAGGTATVVVPADAPVGVHTVRLATAAGVSNARPLVVDELPEVAEVETNRTKDAAQELPVPCVVTGRADGEAADYFRVPGKAGQTLTFEVLGRRLGSPIDPIVVLHDGKTKRELVDRYADDTPGLQTDARLTHTFAADGSVLVEVRDTTYRGGPDFFYRLRVGDFPGVTTAFPLAVQRGKSASVGFSGPGADALPAVTVNAADANGPVLYATPKRPGGLGGWPVPVRVSDFPEGVEQEPNDDPAHANALPVPGGVSARFAAPNDRDHFRVAGKKGQKLAATVLAFEVNAPTEVLVRVLDAKGAEVARSDPAKASARCEWTPAADGEFVVACEHLNYLSGPNEVYHLSVRPAAPDFELGVALDRADAPPGGGTAFGPVTVTRLNGFAGPVELTVAGDSALSGSVTVPAAATTAFVPLLVKAGTKPGPLPLRVRGTAKIDGADVTRFAASADAVKGAFPGLPNPPAEAAASLAAGVVDKPPFTLAVSPGKPGTLTVTATRAAGFDGEIAVAVVSAPQGVTVAAKPIGKGATTADAAVTGGPAGPVVLKGTAKVDKQDFAVTAAPVVATPAEGKKPEPKAKEKK